MLSRKQCWNNIMKRYDQQIDETVYNPKKVQFYKYVRCRFIPTNEEMKVLYTCDNEDNGKSNYNDYNDGYQDEKHILLSDLQEKNLFDTLINNNTQSINSIHFKTLTQKEFKFPELDDNFKNQNTNNNNTNNNINNSNNSNKYTEHLKLKKKRLEVNLSRFHNDILNYIMK